MSKILEKIKNSPYYKFETMAIGAAVLLGLIGSMLQHANLVAQEERILNTFATVKVLSASTQLDENTIIKESDISYQDVLASTYTSNMLTVGSKNQIIGKVLKIKLMPGDPLYWSMIQGQSNLETMANKIPIGKRLFVLNIVDPLSKMGFLHPGDKVDVISKMTFPTKGETTFTLLDKVEVISVGKEINKLKGVESTQISFFVTAKEMESLRFAQDKGQFYISLRNPLDQAVSKAGVGTNMETFLLSDKVYESAEQKIKIQEGSRSEEE